jgi:ubiquinone/menaquinone biosynthesis C-methylase UbiE
MSACIDRKKVEFWNERASTKKNPGSDDFILKEIEKKYIASHISVNSRVLDIGCGNGETLIELHKNLGIKGNGVDFSDVMIEESRKNAKGIKELSFSSVSILDINENELGIFDVVYTQRCLINLGSFEEQAKAINKIYNMIKPSGIFIMVESTNDGLKEINKLRGELGLDLISVPWHNHFFNIKDVEGIQKDDFIITEFKHISSTYNFLSRAVYAKLAQQNNEDLKYDSEINTLSLSLPQEIGTFGPVKGWIWKKIAK